MSSKKPMHKNCWFNDCNSWVSNSYISCNIYCSTNWNNSFYCCTRFNESSINCYCCTSCCDYCSWYGFNSRCF